MRSGSHRFLLSNMLKLADSAPCGVTQTVQLTGPRRCAPLTPNLQLCFTVPGLHSPGIFCCCCSACHLFLEDDLPKLLLLTSERRGPQGEGFHGLPLLLESKVRAQFHGLARLELMPGTAVLLKADWVGTMRT